MSKARAEKHGGHLLMGIAARVHSVGTRQQGGKEFVASLIINYPSNVSHVLYNAFNFAMFAYHLC